MTKQSNIVTSEYPNVLTGILIDTAKLGVAADDRGSLCVTIRCLGNVKRPVKIDDKGVLYLEVEPGQLTGKRLKQLVDDVKERVDGLCKHKGAVPGPGSTRRVTPSRKVLRPRRGSKFVNLTTSRARTAALALAATR